jgi:hypothetical protein
VIRLYYILIFFFLLGNQSTFAQKELKIENVKTNDTLKKKSKINPLAPSKAAFYSAILPGLGQAYNKKYWKIPLVYGAIGTGIYSYAWNNKKYHEYRDAYKSRLAGEVDDNFRYLDDTRLISAQKFHQKNRDLSALVSVALYILNIVDANVDAHLMQFNVNEDLTIRPEIQQNQIDYKQGVAFTLSYKF